MRLHHAVQHETKRQRAIRRADRIRHCLGWDPGLLRPWGKRPPRMRRTTHDRLTHELAEIEDWLLPDLSHWARRAMNRKG
jgi:hypothetical protein